MPTWPPGRTTQGPPGAPVRPAPSAHGGDLLTIWLPQFPPPFLTPHCLWDYLQMDHCTQALVWPSAETPTDTGARAWINFCASCLHETWAFKDQSSLQRQRENDHVRIAEPNTGIKIAHLFRHAECGRQRITSPKDVHTPILGTHAHVPHMAKGTLLIRLRSEDLKLKIFQVCPVWSHRPLKAEDFLEREGGRKSERFKVWDSICPCWPWRWRKRVRSRECGWLREAHGDPAQSNKVAGTSSHTESG